MSKLRVSQILTDQDAERDAIHVPIIKVIATEVLNRGESLYLSKDDAGQWCAYRYNQEVYLAQQCFAIVDPFIKKSIEAGDYFYAWLEPGTLQNLYHVWTHPVLDRKKK